MSKKVALNLPSDDNIMSMALDFINEDNDKMIKNGDMDCLWGDEYLCGLQAGMVLMVEEVKRRNG